MTVLPPITTVEGVMSPIAFVATSAYGTLESGCRGFISGSIPTLMPRKRVVPLKAVGGIGVVSPSVVEKYPSSSVICFDSVQSAIVPS